MSWGGKTQHDADWDRVLREEFQPRFLEMKAQVNARKLYATARVYGYFHCNAYGNDLIVYHPQEEKKEIVRFNFPRQPDKDLLCLSDYFAPVESGRIDVAAFQIVTVGSHVLDLIAAYE